MIILKNFMINILNYKEDLLFELQERKGYFTT
jgi:hypothetical protein